MDANISYYKVKPAMHVILHHVQVHLFQGRFSASHSFLLLRVWAEGGELKAH